MEKQRVLFLCTENAARSQMAEALLRHHAGDRFEALSAGMEPTQVHPMARRVLEEINIDTAKLESKSLKIFLARVPIHYAIVLCEKAHQRCPQFYPFAMHVLYWPFENPVDGAGSEEELLEVFRRTRDQIDERLRAWLTENGVA